MRKIILASQSPRRKELLEKIGIKFDVEVSSYKESHEHDLKPQKLAEFLSLQKAKDVAKNHKDAIVIAADTFVVFENEILGKPHTKSKAIKMLGKLSGKAHLVITGFTVLDSKTGKTSTASVITKVYFRKMTKKEINDYAESGEPLDKAGGYGIQGKGGIFIEKIDGDYFNVVGLPLCALMNELKNFDILTK